jgi:hypothetical protein
MKTHSVFRSATTNVLIGLSPALIGPLAVTEGFADAPLKPAVVEIDAAVLKIDIVAALRAVRESLNEAHVVEAGASKAKGEVKMAENERRDRG